MGVLPIRGLLREERMTGNTPLSHYQHPKGTHAPWQASGERCPRTDRLGGHDRPASYGSDTKRNSVVSRLP
jgi:hypothetical protein